MRWIHVTAIVLCTTAASWGAIDDDFDDNAAGPSWVVEENQPADLGVVEQNQRVEVIATGQTVRSDDALYRSDGAAGHALRTSSDFEAEVDFTLNAFRHVGDAGDDAAALGFVFGVGRDADGTDVAAISWGLGDAGIFILSVYNWAYRTDDDQAGPMPLGPTPALGSTVTFVVAYDSVGDDLTLSVKDTAISATLEDTVQAVWGADELMVSFGARGGGFELSSGDAYFDNFHIVSGVHAPEPASLGLLGIGSLVMLRRRSRT